MNTPVFYPPPSSTPLVLQGVLLRRFCAFLLDFVFMGVFICCVFFAITIFGILTLGLGWIAFHIVPVLPFIYYILLISGAGATPGQRICGLTLRQNHDLSPPTFAQICVWTLLFWLSLATLGGLPFLLAFCNQRGRAAHDLLSGLVFVRSTQFFY